MTCRTKQRIAKLVELVRKNPGKDGQQLKQLGLRTQIHGSIRDAEKVHGVVEYRNGGWYVKE